jgi:hypothetical protein
MHRPKSDMMGLWDLVSSCPGQTLVFCMSKANCEKFSNMFSDFMLSSENNLGPPRLLITPILK